MMTPVSFRFVATNIAQRAKGLLYGMKPARENAAPQWHDDTAAWTAGEVSAPLTNLSQWKEWAELTTLTFRKPTGERLVMNDAIVAISRKKNIVSTPMTGRTGTVKEYINAEDYQLNIVVGVQAMSNGVIVDEYPKDGIKELREYFDTDEVIGVHSDFLEMFGINRIVITSFSLTQSTESNYQAISVSAISDEEYDIYSEEY